MDFKDILITYEMHLDVIKRMKKTGLESTDFILGMARSNFYWFQEMSAYVEREYEQIDIDSVNREQYKVEGNLPHHLVKYRGEIIAIYSDDYGQQDYAVIRGQEYAGGSYNFMALDEFMYQVDRILLEEFLGDGDLCRDDG